MRKALCSAVGLLLSLALLTGCQGKALPEGMSEDALLEETMRRSWRRSAPMCGRR